MKVKNFSELWRILEEIELLVKLVRTFLENSLIGMLYGTKFWAVMKKNGYSVTRVLLGRLVKVVSAFFLQKNHQERHYDLVKSL